MCKNLINIAIIALAVTSHVAQCATMQEVSVLQENLVNILDLPHISHFIENIQFWYFNNVNGTVAQSVAFNQSPAHTENCSAENKFAIIVHGWRESCAVEWAKLLVNNLNKYRGGCVLCMDYSVYADHSYRSLVSRFEQISTILVAKLIAMEIDGFNPDRGYIFGFSFGGRLASTAGQQYGIKKLKEMDLCDIAGPGFDYRSQHVIHSRAAQNVQCIRTSGDKGTRYSTCDQDWKMGICGIMQVAAADPPFGSHGLCPYFYNAAFEYDFLAIEKPEQCSVTNAAINRPVNFKMGYMEDRKHLVRGELFAETTKEYPFTHFKNSNVQNELENDRVSSKLQTIQNDGEYKSNKRIGRNRISKASARRQILHNRIKEFNSNP